MKEEDIEGLGDDLDTLDDALAGARTSVAGMAEEAEAMRAAAAGAGREIRGLSSGIDSGLRKAFDGLIFGGDRLSDSLRNLGRTMVGSVYNAAAGPATASLGKAVSTGVEGLLGSVMPFQKGGAFVQGRPKAFARGGVVDRPTTFPMHRGTGLMGEAGPEAVLPLARGPDGRLGVRAGSHERPVHVAVHVSTPDAASFRRSQAQIAAELGRAIGRGQRIR